MSWTSVVGRVAFTNCDPLFHGLDERWSVLSAPPAWLTGHVLRKDCLTAPIPTADFAKHSDKLTKFHYESKKTGIWYYYTENGQLEETKIYD